MRPDPEHTRKLIEQLAGGDVSVLGPLFVAYREQLRCEIARNLAGDPRLATRFDASDVVQELFRDAQQQVGGYVQNQTRIEFLTWLRGLARERFLKFQRDHLDAQCRTLKRQTPLPEESWRHPAAEQESPSEDVRAAERDDQVRRA